MMGQKDRPRVAVKLPGLPQAGGEEPQAGRNGIMSARQARMSTRDRDANSSNDRGSSMKPPRRGVTMEVLDPGSSPASPSQPSTSKTPRLSRKGTFHGPSPLLTPRKSLADVGPPSVLGPHRISRPSDAKGNAPAPQPGLLARTRQALEKQRTEPLRSDTPETSSRIRAETEKPDKRQPVGPSSSRNNFEEVVGLSKRHGIDVMVVRNVLKDFQHMDLDDSGQLSMDEFKAAIRKNCGLEEDSALPRHLLDEQYSLADEDNDGTISFEEYLIWCTRHAWVEEMMVNDPKVRQMRNFARRCNIELEVVEEIKRVYDKFDANGNGVIEQHEFRQVLMELLGHNDDSLTEKRFRQYWLEVDTDLSGEINFEEFSLWYTQVFPKG